MHTATALSSITLTTTTAHLKWDHGKTRTDLRAQRRRPKSSNGHLWVARSVCSNFWVRRLSRGRDAAQGVKLFVSALCSSETRAYDSGAPGIWEVGRARRR